MVRNIWDNWRGTPLREAIVYDLRHQVLRTDASGMPLEWVDYQDAVRLYHLEQVAYACGSLL